MKIRPVGAELFNAERTDGQTDRQTDITNLIVAFRNIANAPKTQSTTLEDKTENPSRRWNIHFENEEIPDAKGQHAGSRT